MESRILKTGETVMFVSGGNGLEVLDEIEIIGVKHGPYIKGHDKKKIKNISQDDLVFKKGRFNE